MLVPCAAIIKGVSEIIVKDKSFHTTHKSKTILKAAEMFLEWARPPHTLMNLLSSPVIYYFILNLVSQTKRVFRQRENTYAHSIMLTEHYLPFILHGMLSSFIQFTRILAQYFQSITHNILNHLISQRYPSVGNPAVSTPTVEQLNNIEENALRYVAGQYVCPAKK